MKYLLAALLTLVPGFAQHRRVTLYRGRPAVSHQVIVHVSPGSPLPDGDLTPLSSSRGLYLLRSRTRDVEELLAGARGLNVEPDYIVHTQDADAGGPVEAQYSQLWGLNRIGVPAAWAAASGSAPVAVGVVDTGVDYTHPDLTGSVWSAPTDFTVHFGTVEVDCPAGSHGFNAITQSCDPMDDNGHGTHVSGTIAASGHGTAGLVGVSPTSPIVGLKFIDSTGSGSLSDAIRTIEFAIQLNRIFPELNLRVLSASWGSFEFSQALRDEIASAADHNMLFVAAAGNNSYNIDYEFSRFYPASYPVPNVVAVAATDDHDRFAPFSNSGLNTVHVAAPGVQILSTYLSGGYAIGSGTSMATPHVSGTALLVLRSCPWLNLADLKLVLFATADPMMRAYDSMIGGGRLNAETAVTLCPYTAPAH